MLPACVCCTCTALPPRREALCPGGFFLPCWPALWEGGIRSQVPGRALGLSQPGCYREHVGLVPWGQPPPSCALLQDTRLSEPQKLALEAKIQGEVCAQPPPKTSPASALGRASFHLLRLGEERSVLRRSLNTLEEVL